MGFRNIDRLREFGFEILQHEYGVDLDTVQWVEGGVNTPRPEDEDMDLRPLGGMSIEIHQGTSASAVISWKGARLMLILGLADQTASIAAEM